MSAAPTTYLIKLRKEKQVAEDTLHKTCAKNVAKIVRYRGAIKSLCRKIEKEQQRLYDALRNKRRS